MNDADKIALLEALIARIHANARGRLPSYAFDPEEKRALVKSAPRREKAAAEGELPPLPAFERAVLLPKFEAMFPPDPGWNTDFDRWDEEITQPSRPAPVAATPVPRATAPVPAKPPGPAAVRPPAPEPTEVAPSSRAPLPVRLEPLLPLPPRAEAFHPPEERKTLDPDERDTLEPDPAEGDRITVPVAIPVLSLGMHEAAGPPSPREEPAPETSSELERAMQFAAFRESGTLPDEEIWSNAADELKTRRSAPPPPPAHSDDPVLETSVEEMDEVPPDSFVTPPLSSVVPRPPLVPVLDPASLPPSSRAISPPSRRLRRRIRPAALRRVRAASPWLYRAIVALGVLGTATLFALGLTWILRPASVSLRGPVAVQASASAPSETAPAAATAAPAESAAPETAPTPTPASPPAAASIAVATTKPSAEPAPKPLAKSSDPPDGSNLPDEKGWLFVQSAIVKPVYINGILAGESGRWLVVFCGWRHVRLAEPGPSPVGKSFPNWASEGNSVMVPCRGATSIAF